MGSSVEIIDLLHFLAGCHKRRLNQALSVLSLSLRFFLSVSVVLLTMATFCVVLFCIILYVLSLGCSCSVVSTSALERLVSEMTYVLMGTLNPTHSLTHFCQNIYQKLECHLIDAL